MRRAILFLVGFGSLAACEGSSQLPAGGLSGLDGTYRGTAALVYGSSDCPELTPYALTVQAGKVAGEIYDSRNPTVVKIRFQTELDAAGTIGTRIFVGGDEVVLKGAFRGDRVLGSVETSDCSNRLTLRRVSS
jgi:hypothetical protein